MRQLIVAVSLSITALFTHAAENAGFELPLNADGQIPGWTLNAADQGVLTQGDDGADYAVFGAFGISVEPLYGDQSLLLGTPKQVSESQNRGVNEIISTPFVPTSDSFLASFRLFSLEHRSDDQLVFEVLDADGGSADLSQVQFVFTPVGDVNSDLESISHNGALCPESGPTCAITIDIGKREKRPFDSGKYQVEISGLPTNQSIQLRYAVIAGNNEAHATFAYFDSANRPPTATLRVNPGGDSANPAFEGDFVVADCLDSQDPDGGAITCDWIATGGGWLTPRTATGETAIFWFPDNQPVTIQLTVTDNIGETAQASQSLSLINVAPLVNAVNVELLAGSIGQSQCRFADPGIGRFGEQGVLSGQEERHSLVSGTQLPDGYHEEWQPSLSSGFFQIQVDDTSTIATCAVSDGEAVGSDDYEVVVVQPAELATRLESNGLPSCEDGAGNESIECAVELVTDWQYLGTISDPGDIDVYKVKVRDDAGSVGSLPVGSELLVSLTNLPSDYDLLVLSNGGSTEASPFFNAPFFNAPFFNAPFFNAPFFNAPFFNAQFNSVPFFNAPFFNAPFFNAPFFNAPVKSSPFFNASTGGYNRLFADFPLSEVGLAAPDGSNISGSDIGVAEIGSRSLRALQASPGLSLKAISAEPNAQDEKILVKVAPGESEIYVVVVGSDLTFSATQPYSLTLESSTPPSQKELLASSQFCLAEAVIAGQPLNEDSTSSAFNPPKYASTWAVGGDSTTNAGTLILTQRERLEIEQADAAQQAVAVGLYGSLGAYWQAFWLKVDQYAAAVGGTVVSIDGSLYENADRNPCEVATRNQLVETIRQNYIVNNEGEFRGGFDAVVIVGGQNIVPVYAVPDETVVGNERDFTTDLWVRPGTPLAVATAEGYNLTDAVYVDRQPTPFRGRFLYLEDLPIARLVETPAAISANIDAFLRRSSSPNIGGNLAVGYDFFCDGTQEAAAILGVDPLNGPPCAPAAWTAQELNERYLRGGAQMCTLPDAALPLEIALINAHMTTYVALSAAGFEQGLIDGDYSDTLASVESEQCLDGTLTATIGCHSGLNIPNSWALPDALDLPFAASRDWVEELGFMVAPRGYGLGDNTVSNRGTEGLMTLLFEELAKGPERQLGESLVAAKRRYVMGLRELDVHDEDSLINLTLFAPPQLTYPSLSAGSSPTPAGAAVNATSAMVGALSIKIRESRSDGSEDFVVGSSTAPASYDLIELTDDDNRGRWFELSPGDAQATYGRPLIPVLLPIEDRLVGTTPDNTRIHGVALVGRDEAISPCPIDGRPSCFIAARYVDLEDENDDGLFDFNPVFPLPQHDWLVYEDNLDLTALQEPSTCVETLAPTQLGVASTLDAGVGVRQSLIVGAAQFRCETGVQRPDAPGQVVGQYRLFNELQLSALHPLGQDLAEAQVRDNDFDSPQVLVQTVVSDPDTNDIQATVTASDALTGASGISEIIALVFWDEDQTAPGVSGVVESYSVKPAQLTEEPFGHTFTLANARNQRVAFQYVDGAGNLTQKSLKGSLIRAIDVDIISTLISLTAQNTVDIFVGEFCSLQSPSITYQIGDSSPITLALDDPLPSGFTIDIDPDCALPENESSDATLSVTGFDFSVAADGSPLVLTVEVRGIGAIGSDTAVLSACTDPNEPNVLENADIIGCNFAVEGSTVVIDMFIAGVLDPDVQYRLDLPQFNAQFKRFQDGKTSKPGGTQLSVVEGPSSLQFRIGNLTRLGWDGQSPIRFQQSTQSGVPGTPSQGFPDETQVFTGQP